MSETPESPKEITPLVRAPEVDVQPPGSKSMTNRALLLAAIADRPSRIEGPLFADDSVAMRDGLQTLGARVTRDGDDLEVEPINHARCGDSPTIDARLSGTTSRFLLPLSATMDRPVVVDGEDPLRRRPMGAVADALARLGAQVAYLDAPGCLPIRIDGSTMHGGVVSVAGGESSQFVSAMLLSGTRFDGGVTIAETGDVVARPFIDMTLRMMADFGIETDQSNNATITVHPGVPAGRTYRIESDATAATYFWAAAAITGGTIGVRGIPSDSCQGDVQFVNLLEQMGAIVTRTSDSVTVTGSDLHGIDVDLSTMPDTAQTLAATAVFASSPTRVRGVSFIRGHETDRLASVVHELVHLGIDATQTEDGFVIVPGTPKPGVVQTHHDHRMAMSFALLGLRVPGISIADPAVVDKTYPNFWRDLDLLSA